MIMVTKISKLCITRAVLNSSMNKKSRVKNHRNSLKSIIQTESLQSSWSKTQERISFPEGSLKILVKMKMTTQIKSMRGQ